MKKAIRKDEQLRFQQPSQFKLYEGKVQQNNGGLYEMSSNGINHRTKKIFVGGLSSTTTEEEFKTYFEKFGRTTDVVVMHDGVTNRPRGFGFVTFDSEDSVEVVMQSSFHELSDKRVEVKRAIPKEGIQSNNGNQNVPLKNDLSFQATPYVPEQNGYGMLVQQYPPAFGYHQGVQGFHYPYGYQFAAQVPWNNPIMQPTGFYCPPPPPPPPLPYINGFDLSGMSIPGYNTVPWPVAGDGAGALIPQFEDLKLEVPSQAHKRINGGGNMGKPLQNGTYR